MYIDGWASRASRIATLFSEVFPLVNISVTTASVTLLVVAWPFALALIDSCSNASNFAFVSSEGGFSFFNSFFSAHLFPVDFQLSHEAVSSSFKGMINLSLSSSAGDSVPLEGLLIGMGAVYMLIL